MRQVTLIGRIMVTAIAVTTLTAMSAQAEARGFRLRFGIGGAAARTPSMPTRQPNRVAAAGAPIVLVPSGVLRPASAASEPSEIRVTEVAPVAKPLISEAIRPAPQPVRVAGAWCAPDRIVGAGAGFCQIN